MKTEHNKQKLMRTRTGQVIPKPRVRKRKGAGRGSFPWPVEERRRIDRTRWFAAISDLFRDRGKA